MRVVVCVKHVPDLQSARSLGEDGRLVRGGDDDTLNELDEDALEAGLRTAEAAGFGKDDGGEGHDVTVLTVGPAPAVEALRRGLAMGASTAVHVSDEALAGSDAIATARVLAAAVAKLHAEQPVDLVVAGMAALDGLTSLVPAALAEVLGWPQLTLADRIEVTDGLVTVRRETSTDVEVLTAPAPAVLSVTDQAFRARFPNFKGIVAARKKPVATWSLADLGVDPATVGSAGSATWVAQAAERPERSDRVLVTGDAETVPALVDYLSEKGFA
ncbi:electron transfer flavoprotein subunit beta/FixA family protein [Kineococcus rhizosphaerae]|uniref:Electron transfer flavoprotein subunit beta n=1 Tax=Kineococcus rhizosphaerae TaxID=559628 RepID=A0A2T0R584_9ACTN|nr:electron transfer flavoprotein subunit beta/FixA family protein [Kineococcus rhizosphaerae]PRY15920.1 electron transfer flavoprotein beta subunit [Kineococcus rhizosphaerae]